MKLTKRSLVGHVVSDWRREAHQTQRDFAEQAHVPLDTLRSIEQGAREGINANLDLILRLAGGPQQQKRIQQVAQAATADRIAITLLQRPADAAGFFTMPLDKGTGDQLARALSEDDVLYPEEISLALRALLDLAHSEKGEWPEATSRRQQAYYHVLRSGSTLGKQVIVDLYPAEESDLVRRSIEIGAALGGDSSILGNAEERLLYDQRAELTNLAYYAYWHNERPEPHSPQEAYRSVDGEWAGDGLLRGLARDLQSERPIETVVLITLATLLAVKGAAVFRRCPSVFEVLRTAVSRRQADPATAHIADRLRRSFGRLLEV